MSLSTPTVYTRDSEGGADTIRQPLRVLLVEDNPDDAALVLRVLRRGGYEPDWHRVQTAEALEQALAQGGWEIVLSDYSMPQFDALRALHMLRDRSAFLPFIIISGSIGEETAVAAMRAGANDYVMKTNLRATAARRGAGAARRAPNGKNAPAPGTRAARPPGAVSDDLRRIAGRVDRARSPRATIRHLNRAVSRTLGYDERFLIGPAFRHACGPSGSGRSAEGRCMDRTCASAGDGVSMRGRFAA